MIENLHYSGPNAVAVAADYSSKLQRIDPSDTWIWGNVDPGIFQAGKIIKTARSGALLANGKIFTKAQPTYKELTKDEVVNVKAVQTHP